jgi:hypothetical protein
MTALRPRRPATFVASTGANRPVQDGYQPDARASAARVMPLSAKPCRIVQIQAPQVREGPVVHYVADEDFHATTRVIAELANAGRLDLITAAISRLRPRPTWNAVTPDQVAKTLGEIGHIWPASLVLTR